MSVEHILGGDVYIGEGHGDLADDLVLGEGVERQDSEPQCLQDQLFIRHLKLESLVEIGVAGFTMRGRLGRFETNV